MARLGMTLNKVNEVLVGESIGDDHITKTNQNLEEVLRQLKRRSGVLIDKLRRGAQRSLSGESFELSAFIADAKADFLKVSEDGFRLLLHCMGSNAVRQDERRREIGNMVFDSITKDNAPQVLLWVANIIDTFVFELERYIKRSFLEGREVWERFVSSLL